MSIEGQEDGDEGAPEEPATGRGLAAHRLMLRLAFGTAGSFALAEALDWELSFLIPVLVVQLLAVMPAAPPLAQGLVVMAMSAGGLAGAL